MQYMEEKKVNNKIKALLEQIQTLRENFASQMKLQAEAFIKFLNIEAENERERHGQAGYDISTQVCKDSGAIASGDYSCQFSVNPNSLSAGNTMYTTTTFSGYTAKASTQYSYSA